MIAALQYFDDDIVQKLLPIMVKLVNFFCLIHILRYLNTIFVSPNPVFRLNLAKDAIMFL